MHFLNSLVNDFYHVNIMGFGYYGMTVVTQAFVAFLGLTLLAYYFVNRTPSDPGIEMVNNPAGTKVGGRRYKTMDPSYGIVGFIFAFSIFAWDYLTNL